MIFDVTSDVGIGFSPGVEIDETISSDSHVSSQPNHAALRHEVKNRIHHGGATDDEEKRIEENQCWDNSIFGAPHGIGGDGIFTFAEGILSNCSSNSQNQHLSSMSPEIAAAAVDALKAWRRRSGKWRHGRAKAGLMRRQSGRRAGGGVEKRAA